MKNSIKKVANATKNYAIDHCAERASDAAKNAISASIAKPLVIGGLITSILSFSIGFFAGALIF